MLGLGFCFGPARRQGCHPRNVDVVGLSPNMHEGPDADHGVPAPLSRSGVRQFRLGDAHRGFEGRAA